LLKKVQKLLLCEM